MLYTLIGYPSGVIVEAVVLVMTGDRMLMAASGFADALALTRSNEQWLTESGENVDLEFLLAAVPAAGSMTPIPALTAGAAG